MRQILHLRCRSLFPVGFRRLFPVRFRSLFPVGFRGLFPVGFRGLFPVGFRGLFPVLAFLAASACGVLSPDDGAQHELDTNRDRWQGSASEHEQYVLQQTVMCFCIVGPDPHEVSVVGDSITAVRNLETGEPLPRQQWQTFRTVDTLFEMVQRGIDEADSLDVSYHPLYGYPVVVTIDYMTNAADDEISVRTELVE